MVLRDGSEGGAGGGGKGGSKAGVKGGPVSEMVPEEERERAASSLLFSELGLSRKLVRGERVGGGLLLTPDSVTLADEGCYCLYFPSRCCFALAHTPIKIIGVAKECY